MIALVMDEHLRLVREAAERGRMDDAVAVALEFRPGRRRRLGNEAPGRARGVGRIGRAAPCPASSAIGVPPMLRFRPASIS